MKYLFGPVNSRRLGLSLGIDLIPSKICSFDCIYCEVGPKKAFTCDRKAYSPLEDIKNEMLNFLGDADSPKIDIITITASGEPTLHTGIGELIEWLKTTTTSPIAVLTNGSLFFNPEVRKDLHDADIVVPSLDAVRQQSYQKINRPLDCAPLDKVISGLIAFRQEFNGQLWLEVLVVKDCNDHQDDIAALRNLLPSIRPDRLQLNTVVRPPTQSFAKPVSKGELEKIAKELNYNVEIIATFAGEGRKDFRPLDPDTVVTILQRRPCTAEDICQALQISRQLVDEALAELLKQKRIIATPHDKLTYYRSAI